MANDSQGDPGPSEPQRVDVHALLTPKTSKHGNHDADEADGAMFSRIPSNLDSVINGQNTRISDIIASPRDDVITPVSVKPIRSKPNAKVLLKDNTDTETTQHHDEIDTGETEISNDTAGRNHDKDALLDDGDDVDDDDDDDDDYIPVVNFGDHADHASFKRHHDNHKHVTNNKAAGTKSRGPENSDNIKGMSEDKNDTVVEYNDGETICTPLRVDKEEEVSPFLAKHVLSLLFPLASVVVFLADIGTDMQLAVSYKRKGATDLFYATLACIIIPSIIMAVVDLSWMWIDHKNREATQDKEKNKGGNCLLAGRVILGALSFGRIVRAVYHMYHIVRKKTGPRRSWHRDKALDQKRDCYMLDFINAFAESCPQLFVQVYLLYKYDLPLELIRVVSLFTSWVSIAWTYASYYRCSREAKSRRQDVNTFGFLLFFFSVLAGLAPRVICVVLFLVYFKLWIGAIVLTSHFLIMLIWIRLQKPELKGTTTSSLGRFMYSLLFAYVSMMCFMNLKDTPARIRMILFYVIIYFENCVMSGLVTWRMFTYGNGHSEKPLNFISLPIGFVIHVTFRSLYYECLHPKTGRRYRTNNV